MIVIYTGVPGSGKTYAATDIIFNNFSEHPKAKKDLKKDYHNCYTNINELKRNKLNHVYDFNLTDQDYHNKVLQGIEKLYEAYKNKSNDDELIEIAKELNLYRSLFVIDEAHNIFSERTKALIWWLTYHRHLYHDIILITQNLGLIDSKYKTLAEYFYRAKPKSLSLNPKYFIYKTFVDSRMSKASHAGDKKILKRKEVFDIYKSGDSVETKNIVLKYIIISLGIFAFLFISFMYYLSTKSKPQPKKQDTNTSIHPPSPASSSSPVPFNNSDFEDRLYNILCTDTTCKLFDHDIPFSVFEALVKKYKLEIISTHKTKYTREIYFISSKDFTYLFAKEDYALNNSSVNISPSDRR
jgi:zona occludens toxin